MNEPRTNLTSRQRLHEYQAMLARRLQEARAKSSTEGFLGVQIGDQHWLLSLSDTGEVLEANDAFCALLKRDRAILLGATLQALIDRKSVV